MTGAVEVRRRTIRSGLERLARGRVARWRCTHILIPPRAREAGIQVPSGWERALRRREACCRLGLRLGRREGLGLSCDRRSWLAIWARAEGGLGWVGALLRRVAGGLGLLGRRVERSRSRAWRWRELVVGRIVSRVGLTVCNARRGRSRGVPIRHRIKRLIEGVVWVFLMA